ncbi:MAG: PAS domain S-box protein [Methylocystis sp.]
MGKPTADNFFVASWACDPHGRNLHIDPVWSEFTGQSLEQTRSAWIEAIHPDDREKVEAARARARKTMAPYRLECRVRRFDGVYRRAFAAVAPCLDEMGVFHGLVGSVVDLEARRASEDALRESGERFRALAQLCAHAVWETDASGVVVEDSPTWRAHTGQTLEEFLGDGWLGAVHPDDRAYADGKWREAVALGASYDAEYRLKWKGGGWRWANVRAAPLLDRAGSVRKWLGVTIDKDESKLAEYALQAIERRYRLLHETLRDPFVCTDMDGRILECNELYREMLGYSEEELLTLTYQQLTPEKWREMEDAVIREQILPRGYSDVYEKEYRRKDGAVFPIELRTVLSRYEDGAPCAMWAIVREITERKTAEESLRNADRRKDEFIALLAHELRNPLVPIHNGVHLLKAREQKSGAVHDGPLLDMMERQVANLVRLVDDLLEISRIASGRIKLRREPTDVVSVLRSSMETSRASIEIARHEATFLEPSEPLFVDGDPVRLGQIFANILNNAVKYTPEGGRIDIKVERRGRTAVVTVRDNGRGIGPQDLPHVFDAFARGDKSGDGGLGIGLALVRKLVELHGGTVEATSEGPGQGSAFIVSLPLIDVNAPVAYAEAPTPSRIDRRALVIDDDRDVADTLAMVLESIGATVGVAYGGQDAMRALESFEPDIVFLDLGMPEPDGFQTAQAIRRSEIGRKLTLVALTGWGQADDRARTREAGFDAHLTKPASVEELTALLHAARRPSS